MRMRRMLTQVLFVFICTTWFVFVRENPSSAPPAPTGNAPVAHASTTPAAVPDDPAGLERKREEERARCVAKRIATPGPNHTLAALEQRLDRPYAAGSARGVYLMTMKIRASTIKKLSKTLEMLDTNLNCHVKAPLFLFYDLVHLHKNDDARATKMTLDMLKTIAGSSKCTQVTLVRIDEFFTMPRNANTSIMLDDIEHGIPAGAGYRSMCRFWSGLVFLMPQLREFDYYMRLDDGSKIMSPIAGNPFEYMEKNNITYMYRGLANEAKIANPGLKAAVDEYWCGDRPHSIHDHVTMYYNNWEMGSFKFFRSRTYQSYFQFLDAKAGFHHHRWGDAVVRTFAMDAMLPEGAVRQFTGFRYDHSGNIWPTGAGDSSGGVASRSCHDDKWPHRKYMTCPNRKG